VVLADGRRDAARGLRAFVVGTGGARLYRIRRIHPLSEFRFRDQWGLLRLQLQPGAYAWEFITVAGQVRDRGRAHCVARKQR